MKQALWLVAAATALVLGASFGLGVARTAAMGFGALGAMAALIAATFLWLWWVRATPLALGMVLSWAGMAAMSGGLAGSAGWVGLAALPPMAAGVTLHFGVMRRSMGLGPFAVAVPVAAAVLGAAAAFFITNP